MMASWPNLPEPPRFQSLDKPAVTGRDMPEHSNAYKTLKNFIREEMRMSRIYQPVMLMKLLQNRGKAKIRDIAKSLLSHDQSQIEYYESGSYHSFQEIAVAQMIYQTFRRFAIRAMR